MKKIIAVGLVFLSNYANATLITSNTITNPTTIDFSTQATLSNVSGPIQIGGLIGENVTVSGSPNTGLFTNYDGWGLITNGTWGDGMTYVSANNASGSLIFSFNDGPVSAVGGFINHVPIRGADLFISAYDSGMNILETYNITTLADIVTPNGVNQGGFRGIDLGLNNISFFEVAGYVPVLDDFTFSRTVSVPEPTSLTLLVLGLVGFGFSRKRI